MAGLQPEQHVEVIDKAVILDELNGLPGVEAFDLFSGEGPAPIAFASARVGSLATAEASGGNQIDLRGVLSMDESASLYGVIRVTRPGHWDGGHLAVVQMGAYNGKQATALGVVHPQVGTLSSGVNAGQLSFSPNANGSVGVKYDNSIDSSAVVEGFMRPASQAPMEMLQIPSGMWVPDASTDKHLQWMLASRPSQG